MKRSVLGSIGAVMLASCANPGHLQSEPNALSAARACEALTSVKSDAASITSATSVTEPFKVGTLEVNAKFCRVQGVARPSSDSEIKFEVWLPPSTQAWNGRFKLNGTGGFAGSVPYARLAQDVSDGMVAAGSNMGHDGGLSAGWTLHRPEKVKDWGLRSHYYVATAAKTVANAFYGKPVSRSYFEGCSNGGRQAMLMAQRYPELFDGIVAGAPSQWYPDLLMWLLWMGKTLTPVEGQPAVLPPAKLKLLGDSARAACDANDGLADGQISNPRVCSFDPSAMRCTAGDAPNCLTDAQVAAAKTMYGGSRSSTGVWRYSGAQPGSEASWNHLFADSGGYGRFIGNFVYGITSPPFDWRRELNWDDKFDAIKAVLTPITAAPSPDLSAFKARGGKLIQAHGWSDPLVPPQGSPAYYNALVQFEKLKSLPRAEYDAAVNRLSGTQVTADSVALAASVQGYHRLFMLPEVGHCAGTGGTGPGAVGGGFTEPAKAQRTADSHLVSALVRWVEQGVAPTTIVATRYAADGTTITRQRPACAYPQMAVYRGGGDVNAASSFQCITPSADQLPTSDADIALIQNAMRQRDVLVPTR
jgi:feruloyl esterase